MSTTFLSDEEARLLYAGPAIGPDAAHDFDHVLRVTHLAVQLAAAAGADAEVVRLAALLHDVPVPAAAPASDRAAHHLAAADYAGQLLGARSLDAPRIANVVHCITAHRFRDRSVAPATLEAQCLYDADKLDSIGAIGVARAFAYAGAHGSRLWRESWVAASAADAAPWGADYTPVHEFVYKLGRIVETLHTDAARSIAAERHRFMCAFFDRLDAEMLGNA